MKLATEQGFKLISTPPKSMPFILACCTPEGQENDTLVNQENQT